VTSFARSGDVYELTLDQAPCNEIGLPLLDTLERFASEVAASDAKAVIIHSARPLGFSAGADLRGLFARLRETDAYLADAEQFIERIHAVLSQLDALPQTTFAALHGVCFGGGFELALVCDVLIADRTTRFAFPELRLGLIPGFGGVPRLRREVPNAVVRDLLLTGRSLSATRAHALGLVSQLVAPGQALSTAQSAARAACAFDREVQAQAKAFTKPLLQTELAAERALFLQMIQKPRVRAALADFVSRSDPMPYLARQPAQPAQPAQTQPESEP
jgi:enoyl-CoA hydratase/carnithine racemase